MGVREPVRRQWSSEEEFTVSWSEEDLQNIQKDGRKPVRVRRKWASESFDSEPDVGEDEITIWLSEEDRQKIREANDPTVDLTERVRRLRKIFINAGAGDTFSGWGPLPDSSPKYAGIANAPHKIMRAKEDYDYRTGTSFLITKAFLAAWISFELMTFTAFHFLQDSAIGSIFFWGLLGGLLVGLPIAWQTDRNRVPGRYWIYRYSPLWILALIILLGLLLTELEYDRWVVLVSMALFAIFALWLHSQLPSMLRLKGV